MDNNIQRPYKGLYMDSSYVDQPKFTYSFALNAVSESLEGDNNKLSFEQSNEINTLLPDDLTILNTTYIGKNSFCIFLVGVHSEIGIVDLDKKQYTSICSDLNSTEKLNFSVSHPIEAVYRLRRGCDKSIYFTDDYNVPRYFNLSSPLDFKLNLSNRPNDFKDVDKYWDINKFNLVKTYDVIPKYKKISVQEGGILKAGSYNFAIQYLDDDLNPTEWLNVSDTIIVYHDSATELSYESIRGSTNKKTDYQDFGETNKSIKIELQNFDNSYTFYRLAIIEATSGTGEISSIKYSETLSIEQTIFNYTGSNAVSQGTVEEIALFQNDIKKAKSILQIENRLLLSNIQGSTTNLCKLQKYASKIKPNFTSKEIILNSTNSPTNSKNPSIHMFVDESEENSVGYMPGEIYSFGIVYIFEGGVKSPVYHIPGVHSSDSDTLMSTNNELENTFYQDNEICDGELGYWGLDYLGNPLINQNVRHHRFPSRKELYDNNNVTEDFTLNINNNQTTATYNYLILEENNIDPLDNSINEVRYRITYLVNNETKVKTGIIDLTNYNESNSISNFSINIDVSLSSFSVQSIEEIDSNGDIVDSNDSSYSGINFITTVETQDLQNVEGISTSRIMGINFTNIDIPTVEEIGEKIIGYYIVQNKRDEDNKTVLDTGIVFPVTQHENWEGVGFLNPDLGTGNLDESYIEDNFVEVVKNKYGLFHPENVFLNKEYKNADIEWSQMYFMYPAIIKESTDIQDAQPGTSYSSERHKKRERDTDGFTLQLLTRKSYASIGINTVAVLDNQDDRKNFLEDKKSINYLNSLHSFSVEEGSEIKEVFNLSADNRFAIVSTNSNMFEESTADYNTFVNVPFLKKQLRDIVILKRDLSDPYSNYRVLPYYKASKNIQESTDTEVTVYSGDSYISPVSITSSIFSDVRIRKRDTKKAKWWKVVLGVIAGIAAIVFTGGIAAIGLATISVGFAVSSLANGLKIEKMNEVYNDLYEQGLRNVVHDAITRKFFEPNPEDDSVQWFSDVIENIYLESGVNMNWRIGSSGQIPDFTNSPKNYSIDFHIDRLADKLTVLDPQNDSGRLYQGFCNAELYELNLDYLRRENEKPFFHLPIEYDCCTDCPEDFPHRIIYSEQSFQEELTDNYRAFLPLSYRDIQGESGDIISMHKIQDNLYIHTEDSLWNLPKNFQERVTDQIVSFIGTGDFFAIPPKLIVDSINGNNAGLQHQRGVIKTPYGIVFVSENEKGIYLFDGKSLKPLHLQGISNWLKNNINISVLDLFQSESVTQGNYPLKDNPYSKYGTGYTLGYDSRKHRILITKKDFVINNNELNGNPDLYLNFENNIGYFRQNLQRDIDELNEGETYLWKVDSFNGRTINMVRDNVITNIDGVDEYVREFTTIVATGIILDTYDNSWTISYNLKKGQWESFMSYQPNLYLTSGDEFYSYNIDFNSIWRHNIKGRFNSFYNTKYNSIVEYVNINSPQTKILDSIKLYTEAKKYDFDKEDYVTIKDKTYNKIVLYNNRQCTGELELVVKENGENSWYSNTNLLSSNQIYIDKNEEDWSLNDIRDIRIDYTEPIWIKDKSVLDPLPFIDKVLNTDSLDFNKDWTQLESFRDKYLVIRLIFDTFDDVNIFLNYSDLTETSSSR